MVNRYVAYVTDLTISAKDVEVVKLMVSGNLVISLDIELRSKESPGCLSLIKFVHLFENVVN